MSLSDESLMARRQSVLGRLDELRYCGGHAAAQDVDKFTCLLEKIDSEIAERLKATKDDRKDDEAPTPAAE